MSPVDLSIAHATLDGTAASVTVDGPSGSRAGIALGGAYYLVRYPLNATAPSLLTLHRNGMADVSTGVAWRAFDLAAYGMPDEMTIRYGDSLLLTAGADQTNAEAVIRVTDAAGAVYAEHLQPAGSTRIPVPVLFDRAGEFLATATLNGVAACSLAITVVQVDMQGPIACQIGYRREC